MLAVSSPTRKLIQIKLTDTEDAANSYSIGYDCYMDDGYVTPFGA